MPTRKKSKSPKPNKKTGTQRWSKYSPEAAQLFRDLYFKKYERREDGKFDGDGIYNDPTRPYSKLNYNAFYSHIEEIDDRVQAYRSTGTGLGTANFRRLVNIKKIPPPEDRGEGFTNNEDSDEEKKEEEKQAEDEERALSSDSDDSSYFGAKEDDESLEDDSSSGSSSDDEIMGKKTKATEKKKATPAKKKVPEVEEVEKAMKKAMLEDKDDGDLKYMYKLADGRICCVFQLISGFEGNFEFNPGKVKTKVILKRVMQRWAYNARRVFRRKGLGPNNVNVVELQTMMDKQRKDDITAMGVGNPDTYSGQIIRSREVFDVTNLGVTEVLPFFLDENGVQTTDINADAGSGAEWVFFWLRDKDTVKETHPVGRIVRNNRRDRDTMDEDDAEGSRPRARMSEESGEGHYIDAREGEDV